MTAEELQSKVEAILTWPAGTWSDEEIVLVQQRRAQLHSEMYSLVDEAERFDRGLTAEEAERYEGLRLEFDRLSSGLPVG